MGNRKKAWMYVETVPGSGPVKCLQCGGYIFVCDSLLPNSDYEWFCENEDCPNNAGTATYDDQEPEWLRK